MPQPDPQPHESQPHQADPKHEEHEATASVSHEEALTGRIDLTTEECIQGYKNWELESFKLAATHPLDLGRTYLTLSLTAAGLTTSLLGLFREHIVYRILLAAGVCLFLASGFVAATLLMPSKVPIHSDDQADIPTRYNNHITMVVRRSRWWLVLWASGVVAAAVSVVMSGR